MKFRSNNCVSVHLPDLRKAEAFYSGVLGFRLLAKSASQLEYDTGRFLLYVNKAAKVRPPIPSFTVINAAAAKAHLESSGCEIVEDRAGGLYFKDPFGMVYDVIED
jgi:catechol 2,3-dioxygenase-like lactoylglutathione lyase family enzyme